MQKPINSQELKVEQPQENSRQYDLLLNQDSNKDSAVPESDKVRFDEKEDAPEQKESEPKSEPVDKEEDDYEDDDFQQ